MKRIQKFHSFNEGFGKISHFLQSILRKGGDLANDVWEVAKRERQETKIALKILKRLIKGEIVSEGEKKFLGAHSKDLIRILPLIAIQGIPIPIPITPLLIILGKKYGFDFLPKDNRSLLKTEVELPEDIKLQLTDLPESKMGFHVVDIILKNGRVLKDRIVINSQRLIVTPEDDFEIADIEEISIVE
jgi:hypothetical protein